MDCKNCGRPNSEDARFCNACGTALTPRPPARAPYTPPHIADKILGSRSALVGERKQVTVLFADVKGSLGLSSEVGAEEWHRIMDRFFDILTEGVHRFEGTVNQYMGDGIMALFGAPVAHEDHAARACYAALHLSEELGGYARELRRERGIGFSVRIGMNSGEVVVGAIGDDLRMDYTALGYTVGLASRMEELAEPGAAYLTGHTATLVGGLFDLDDLGPFEIKGVPERVQVFQLKGPGELRTRLEVARERGFSRFVGRREEMDALETALGRAREGAGQVVGVMGEPGVGKSRLCYELAQRARAEGVKVFEAHGVAHGRTMAFLPVLELLRGYFGITEKDGPVAARQRIAGSLLLLDEGFREALPLVFDVLGVPDPDLPSPQADPDARRRQLFGVIGHLIQSRSKRGPALVVMEDLQWIDAGSEEFLEHLVEAVQPTRTMLLLNFRPEYRAEWMQRSHYRHLALQPLGAEAITELLDHLLGRDVSLDSLAKRIGERTGGNPFFVEEVVRVLIESGPLEGDKGSYRLVRAADAAEIPATVQAVLASRIDRLAPVEKEVLQTAAVIGREFPEPVLRAVTDASEPELAAALRGLVGAEFLYERALYPEAEYAFKHPLTQEVAYTSQLTERRASVHGDVARTVEKLYPDRLDERSALLAHHWEQAGDAGQAARWNARAAEWAGHSDVRAALGHWRKVREYAESSELRLAACVGIMNFGVRLGLPEPEAQAVFDEGKGLAESRGDEPSLARLLLVYGRLRGHAGEVEEAVAHSLEAARLAERTGLHGLRLAAAVNVSAWFYGVGLSGESLGVVDEALRTVPKDLRLGSEHLGYSPYIWLVMHRGRLLPFLGRLAEADVELERAMRLARDGDETEILCWAHQGRVDLAWLSGDVQSALVHGRQALEIAERESTPILRWSSRYALGRAYLMNGEWDAAKEMLQGALDIIRAKRVGLAAETFVLASLAEARVGAGDGEGAMAAADKAIEVAAQRNRAGASWVRARLAKGRVSVRMGRADEAEYVLLDGMKLVDDIGVRVFEPLLRVELAEVGRARGDDEMRRRELAEALRLFEEMGAPGHSRRVADELTLIR